MKFSIVTGSHRLDSQSVKVGRFVEHTLRKQHHDSETFLVDLAVTQLTLWDETKRTASGSWNGAWDTVASELRASDGFVIVAPEWGGMAPPALKNFFLLAGREEVGHKPALIVAVSSGDGGAYPVAELRASSYKNNLVCYIPEHVIVRNVAAVLNGPEAASLDDEYIRERIAHALRMLRAYARALSAMRSQGPLDDAKYPYGM